MVQKLGILNVLCGGTLLLLFAVIIAGAIESGSLGPSATLVLLVTLPLPLASFAGGIGLLRGRPRARNTITVVSD